MSTTKQEVGTRAVTRYRAAGQGTKQGKRLADEANRFQAAQVYRALLEKGPLTFDELMDALDGRAMRSHAKDLGNNVRWYLNYLKKAGLVQSAAAMEKAA